jgi:hypothetical protein
LVDDAAHEQRVQDAKASALRNAGREQQKAELMEIGQRILEDLKRERAIKSVPTPAFVPALAWTPEIKVSGVESRVGDTAGRGPEGTPPPKAAATFEVVPSTPTAGRTPQGAIVPQIQVPPMAVNVAAGFGSGVSLGVTDAIRNRLDASSEAFIDRNSAAYRYSKYAGYMWLGGTGVAAGLYGGASSVFYRGYHSGALWLAGSLPGAVTINMTPIGRGLEFTQAWASEIAYRSAMSGNFGLHYLAYGANQGIGKLWYPASAVFAANAKEGARVVLRGFPDPKSVWTVIEKPILNYRGLEWYLNLR